MANPHHMLENIPRTQKGFKSTQFRISLLFKNIFHPLIERFRAIFNLQNSFFRHYSLSRNAVAGCGQEYVSARDGKAKTGTGKNSTTCHIQHSHMRANTQIQTDSQTHTHSVLCGHICILNSLAHEDINSIAGCKI